MKQMKTNTAPQVRWIKTGLWLAALVGLNAATGLAISNEAYDTVGGWVLDLFGRVPRRGERLETSELSVTVEKIERTRVVEVLLSLSDLAM